MKGMTQKQLCDAMQNDRASLTLSDRILYALADARNYGHIHIHAKDDLAAENQAVYIATIWNLMDISWPDDLRVPMAVKLRQVILNAYDEARLVKDAHGPTTPIFSSVLHRDPETCGGEPVFKGTRVLLENLFGSLEEGSSLDEFLEGFSGIPRETAIAALEEARMALTEKLSPGNPGQAVSTY